MFGVFDIKSNFLSFNIKSIIGLKKNYLLLLFVIVEYYKWICVIFCE